MKCPQCHTKMFCVESRPFGDMQQRRYDCHACVQNWYTQETFGTRLSKRKVLPPLPPATRGRGRPRKETK